MSTETVQFTELVRQAHAQLQAAECAPFERLHWCEACHRDTPHTVHDLDALREVFTCRCGAQTVYTVR